MWATNLKVVGVVLGTLALYTLIANKIPQVQSEVPHALTLGANVTPEQLVTAGDQLFHGAGGCIACHGLGTLSPQQLWALVAFLESQGGTVDVSGSDIPPTAGPGAAAAPSGGGPGKIA